ncbi:flagellar hook-associated protein FlgK [Sulfitobacter aestuariivivens]|uniref:Flagellar hook-associated protein 1 n=1 Tax=Sulfitobacter aestuariivivens TaxID=2766981 RepID=A0A927HF66_9RHOB|nr:flagellar hook-associated protein FlgK [Sulfitobacter aestuariivivens]MBD3665527.1 flagellar hook-associated protein FlgK [Sulfitobacter aestuariivivens]
MSISSAMSNAVLGLRAAGRGAEVISSNIANALTPGYGRRDLALSSGMLGGVTAVGVVRIVDAGLASDRRLAEAANNSASLSAGFFARLEGLYGTPDDPNSVSARLAGFQAALITAASRPDAPDRLVAAVRAANDLATTLQDTSNGIQQARSQADRAIATQVSDLNTTLQQIRTLNADITGARARGVDTSALLDQRQQLVDRIGAIVPVREIQRENGQIALYSTSGAALLDGRASVIDFTPSNSVTPYMSVDTGSLSGLTINDQPVRTGSGDGALRGGLLSAQFEIRDELAPAAQIDVDALARDLVERFQNPAVDPSLAVGDAGLFTDSGSAFDPLNEVGLSQRLAINALVDPAQAGAPWRLRDGINAAAQGPVGDATLLQNLAAALSATKNPASGSFSGTAQTGSALVSNMISAIGVDRIGAEQQLSYTSARFSELTQQQLSDGVDTDDELLRLLEVEQTYAANARMIEVLNELMQRLNQL